VTLVVVVVVDLAHLPAVVVAAAAVTVVDYDAPVAVVDLVMPPPVHYL